MIMRSWFVVWGFIVCDFNFEFYCEFAAYIITLHLINLYELLHGCLVYILCILKLIS